MAGSKRRTDSQVPYADASNGQMGQKQLKTRNPQSDVERGFSYLLNASLALLVIDNHGIPFAILLVHTRLHIITKTSQFKKHSALVLIPEFINSFPGVILINKTATWQPCNFFSHRRSPYADTSRYILRLSSGNFNLNRYCMPFKPKTYSQKGYCYIEKA